MTPEQIRADLEKCAAALSEMIRAQVARLGPDVAFGELGADGRPLLAPLYGDLGRVLAALSQLTPPLPPCGHDEHKPGVGGSWFGRDPVEKMWSPCWAAMRSTRSWPVER